MYSKVKEALRKRIEVDNDLLNLYSLLVLVKGTSCTLEDVHDAWAVWRSNSQPNHHCLVPYKELSGQTKEKDRPYQEAIVSVCEELLKEEY
jgi:hypothetical protein